MGAGSFFHALRGFVRFGCRFRHVRLGLNKQSGSFSQYFNVVIGRSLFVSHSLSLCSPTGSGVVAGISDEKNWDRARKGTADLCLASSERMESRRSRQTPCLVGQRADGVDS